MSTRELIESRRAGGALIMSLVAVTTISMLGAGFLHLASVVSRRQEFSIATKQAFYIAEAGLSEAWAGVEVGKTGNVGSDTDPASFGGGLFWVEATDNADGTRTLESTGMFGTGRASLEIVVDWPDSVATSQSMFSDEPFEIDPGAMIDGYDSAVGNYTPPVDPLAPTASEDAEIQSNGAITVSGTAANPSLVVGTVLPGPASSVTVAPDATVTGATTPADSAVTMPVVVLPTGTLDPGILHGSGVPLLIPSGTTGLDFLQVAAGSEAIIQGPATIVIDDLSIGPLGKLSFDTTGGEINLFISSQLVLAPLSIIETSDYDATKISIRVAGDLPVQLNAGGDFYGVVYAPEAQVDIAESFVLFGSAIARKLELQPGVQLHYDDAIRVEALDALLPVYLGWRVVEIPDAIATNLSSDPFQTLGVDRLLLNPPADSHLDQTLAIVYDDGFGIQTFVGAESAFNWTLVDTILNVARDGVRVP